MEFAKADRRAGGFDDQGGRGGSGGGASGFKRKPNFGIIVSELPRSASWQDLKDFGRKAGDVVFADVDRSANEGVIDYSNKADMENAVRVLNSTEFKNRFDAADVRVRFFDDSGSKGGKDSRERSRSRDNRSPADHGRGGRGGHSRSRSASRGRSPSRSRSPARRSPSPR